MRKNKFAKWLIINELRQIPNSLDAYFFNNPLIFLS
jgi:hypothetical protein